MRISFSPYFYSSILETQEQNCRLDAVIKSSRRSLTQEEPPSLSPLAPSPPPFPQRKEVFPYTGWYSLPLPPSLSAPPFLRHVWERNGRKETPFLARWGEKEEEEEEEGGRRRQSPSSSISHFSEWFFFSGWVQKRRSPPFPLTWVGKWV